MKILKFKKKSPLFRISQRKETVLNKNRKQKQIRSKSFSTKTKLKIKKQKLKNPSNSIIHETQNRKKKQYGIILFCRLSLLCLCIYSSVYLCIGTLKNLEHYILKEKTQIEDEEFPRKSGKGRRLFMN